MKEISKDDLQQWLYNNIITWESLNENHTQFQPQPNCTNFQGGAAS